MKIMILDDDNSRIEQFKRNLNNLPNCFIYAANSSNQAIKLLEENPDFDYLYLDHDLDEGKQLSWSEDNNGYLVAEWMVKNLYGNPEKLSIIIHSFNLPRSLKMKNLLIKYGYAAVSMPGAWLMCGSGSNNVDSDKKEIETVSENMDENKIYFKIEDNGCYNFYKKRYFLEKNSNLVSIGYNYSIQNLHQTNEIHDNIDSTKKSENFKDVKLYKPQAIIKIYNYINSMVNRGSGVKLNFSKFLRTNFKVVRWEGMIYFYIKIDEPLNSTRRYSNNHERYGKDQYGSVISKNSLIVYTVADRGSTIMNVCRVYDVSKTRKTLYVISYQEGIYNYKMLQHKNIGFNPYNIMVLESVPEFITNVLFFEKNIKFEDDDWR